MHAVLLDPPHLVTLVHEDNQATYRRAISVLVQIARSHHGRHLLWIANENMGHDLLVNQHSSSNPKSCSTRLFMKGNYEFEILFHEFIGTINICAGDDIQFADNIADYQVRGNAKPLLGGIAHLLRTNVQEYRNTSGVSSIKA